MKTLLKLILLSTLILNVACKEATEEVEEVKVAICLDENFEEITDGDDIFILDFAFCAEARSEEDINKLKSECRVALIQDGRKCENFFVESDETGICTFQSSGKVYLGHFFDQNAQENQKNNFISKKEQDCNDEGGVWSIIRR